MGEMSDDFEVSTDTATSRRAERYPRPFLRTTPGDSWRNTEQHEYIHYVAHPHRCFCGESENAEVHQRFKRAAARFTQHPYLYDGTTSANCSTCGLRKQSPCHVNVDKPPTTGDRGKDNRVSPITEAEELMNTNQSPDVMEKAALRLATLAQEIREHDEREPQGDEPVITWNHTFENGTTAIEPRVFTYVAVKLDGGWYVTGDKQAGCAHTWRDFLSRDWAKEITTGDFLICTEWTHA